MALRSMQQGHHNTAATTNFGTEFLGNNISAGGNNIFNFNSDAFQNSRKQASEDEKIRKCTKALFVTDPKLDRGKYLAFQEGVIAGTCERLLKKQQYKTWIDDESRSQLLWLSGGAGTGKTVLSLFLTAELEKVANEFENAALCYYFCDGSDPRRSTPIDVLRGLVFSLLQAYPILYRHILPRFEIPEEKLFEPYQIEAMWGVFEDMVNDPEIGPVYCVIDGLDQCSKTSPEHFNHLVKKIRHFFHERHVNAASRAHNRDSETPDASPPIKDALKMAILSRADPKVLEDELSGFLHVQLGRDSKRSLFYRSPGLQDNAHGDSHPTTALSDSHNLVEDSTKGFHQSKESDMDDYSDSLQVYVEAKIEGLAESKQLDLEFRKTLVDRIQGKGENNFLWVDIAIQQLKRCSPETMLSTLDSMPDHLEDMYCYVLEQVPLEHTSVATAILGILSAAFQPLSQSVLDLMISNFEYKEGSEPKNLMLVDTLDLLDSFITKDQFGLYSFRNETAKETITHYKSPLPKNPKLDQFWINSNTAHAKATGVCLRYLENHGQGVGGLHEAPINLTFGEENLAFGSETWERDEETIKMFPLLPYAIVNWPRHLRSAFPYQINMDSDFFKRKSKLRRHWWQSYWSLETGRATYMCPKTTKLHLAAHLDLFPMVKQLSEGPGFSKSLERWDGEYQTPLTVAVCRGGHDVSGFLLEQGAKLFAFNYPILHLACSQGQLRVVQTLIDCYAERVLPNISSADGENSAGKALPLRPLPGRSAIEYSLKSLSKYEVGDSNTRIDGALILALVGGHEFVVKYLLGKGVDIGHKTTKNWTFLHFAALSGSVAIVESVLEQGADPRMETVDRWLPIHVAANEGMTAAMLVLAKLEGMSLEVATDHRQTPLHLAAAMGRDSTVQTLLGHKAFVDARDNKDWTSLHLASHKGHIDVAITLLQHGANVDFRDSKGWTALHTAAAAGHVDIVQALLAFGANRDALTNGKDTPLKIAKGGKKGAVGAVLLDSSETALSRARSGSFTPSIVRSGTLSSTNSNTAPDLNIVAEDGESDHERNIDLSEASKSHARNAQAFGDVVPTDMNRLSPPTTYSSPNISTVSTLRSDLGHGSPPLEHGSPDFFHQHHSRKSSASSASPRRIEVAPWSQSVNSITRSIHLSSSQINLHSFRPPWPEHRDESNKEPSEKSNTKSPRPLSEMFRKRSSSVMQSPPVEEHLVEDSKSTDERRDSEGHADSSSAVRPRMPQIGSSPLLQAFKSKNSIFRPTGRSTSMDDSETNALQSAKQFPSYDDSSSSTSTEGGPVGEPGELNSTAAHDENTPAPSKTEPTTEAASSLSTTEQTPPKPDQHSTTALAGFLVNPLGIQHLEAPVDEPNAVNTSEAATETNSEEPPEVATEAAGSPGKKGHKETTIGKKFSSFTGKGLFKKKKNAESIREEAQVGN